MRNRFSVSTLFAAVIVVGLALAVVGCWQQAVANMEGSWTGTWQETLFGGYDPADMSVTISVDGAAVSATGTIDLSQVGLDAATTGTASGTVSGTTLEFEFASTNVTGSGTGTLIIDTLSGSGTIENYGDFTYEASITGDTITGTYTFVSGGAGEVTLQRQ